MVDPRGVEEKSPVSARHCDDRDDRGTVRQIERLAWADDPTDAREICRAIVRARSFLPGGTRLCSAATRALVVLELASCHYASAIELLQGLDPDELIDHADSATLADIVEAGVRGGDRGLSGRALRRLESDAAQDSTPRDAGLLARSRALLAEDEAEALYREAIDRGVEAVASLDVARSHLLYGEWLRRKKRRKHAQAHLRFARDLFEELGAGRFADRARVELIATGERARKRTVDTQCVLTPQELHIATLAAVHATNREIAQRMYISARTVEYHMHHIFQKLQISSRRQLPVALQDVGRSVAVDGAEFPTFDHEGAA